MLQAIPPPFKNIGSTMMSLKCQKAKVLLASAPITDRATAVKAAAVVAHVNLICYCHLQMLLPG
jgi:hypothetical protein